MNQQLESERNEKFSKAAGIEHTTNRHFVEVARIKESCERETAEVFEKTVFEVSSRYEYVEGMRIENKKHLREMKKRNEASLWPPTKILSYRKLMFVFGLQETVKNDIYSTHKI